MVHLEVIVALCWVGAVKSYIPPINEDDPERYVEWTTPTSFEFWWRYTPGAQYVGLLFAGRTEFPWVVDIRSIDIGQEEWSTGNMITLAHVMTTCRAVAFFLDFQKAEIGSSEWLQEFIGVKVNYCGNYLWENYKFASRLHHLGYKETDVFDTDIPDSGTRYVKDMYKHPKCSEKDMGFDTGIMKLNSPVRPFPPILDTMPIWYDVEKQRITDVDLSNMINQRRVCYVASIGRNWRNWFESYVTDYKVKYRVYYLAFERCREKLNLFRRTREDQLPQISENDSPSKLMCFGTRARVGAVCDHDRGAPLVCDGRVYGFVVRGANFSNCSNLFPLPFIVQRVSVLNDYYKGIVQHVFAPKYTPTRKISSFATLCSKISDNLLIFSFLTSLWLGLTTQQRVTLSRPLILNGFD